jgi:hypothetical protein
MQENFYGFIDGMVACSVGMSENSLAFQRREAEKVISPAGTTEFQEFRSSAVPSELVLI